MVPGGIRDARDEDNPRSTGGVPGCSAVAIDTEGRSVTAKCRAMQRGGMAEYDLP
jgi:hypothetical protein